MKIELTDITPVKKTMAVEVPPEIVAEETAAVVRDYAKKANIPGFRKGKVPTGVIKTRFAKELKEDIRERVLSRAYAEAARAKELRPITDPVLDEVRDEEGAPFTFKTTFEVLPEIELGEYKGIELRRRAAVVEDDEVDKALEELRQSRVQLITEDGRSASIGDVIVADIEGRPEDGEPFQRERMMIELGATDNLPAFNDGLEGVTSGESREFSVDYPAEYGSKELAGKAVAYSLQVHEVKRRQVPDLDDEFAKDLGEFEDLASLRARVQEDLDHRKQHEIERELRQALMDKVLMAHPVVLPDALVEQEIRHRLEEMVRSLMGQGIDPEKAQLDWKDLREKQEEPARKSVHARLMLDAVARAEELAVSDEEIDERIRRDAAAMGEKPQGLRQRLRESNGVELLRSQLVREKSLDLLLAVANIQNVE